MANEYLAYIGTYTSLGSEGIYCYRFDMATGALEHVGMTGAIDDPSFLDIAPSGKSLYAVCADFEAMATGVIRAYSIDSRTGELTLLNERSSEGSGPCHVEVDQTSRYVLLANYGSGSVASYPVQEDGSLGEAAGFSQHEGSSIDPERQEGPHGHSINIDPTNIFAFAADLGIDKVLTYRLNHGDGSLTPAESPYVRTPPGGGPRHFAFHPNGKYAYLLNEMGSSITAMHYDGLRGMLKRDRDGDDPAGRLQGRQPLRRHPRVPVRRVRVRLQFGDTTASPSSVSTRTTAGFHSSATYRAEGRLLATSPSTLRGHTCWYPIRTPATSSPTASTGETGMPEPTGHEVKVPAPVCIKLLPV